MRVGLDFFHTINHCAEFVTDHLTADELGTVSRLITAQYLDQPGGVAPQLVGAAAEAGYHTLTLPFDHDTFWAKSWLVLGTDTLPDFERMGFFGRDWLLNCDTRPVDGTAAASRERLGVGAGPRQVGEPRDRPHRSVATDVVLGPNGQVGSGNGNVSGDGVLWCPRPAGRGRVRSEVGLRRAW